MNKITRPHPKYIVPWLSLALLLVLSGWLRSKYIWTQYMDYDEGHWLMFGVLANAGYQPYTVAFVGIPPLALWTIQLGAKLFGITLALRYPMMLFSLLGIVGIYWLFQPWKSRSNLLAGLLAATFLSFNIFYFHNSATIMAEIPAVALSLLSLALVYQYYLDHKLYWLALSGVMFSLSLALKIFVIFLPILIGILILLTLFGYQKTPLTLTIRRLVITGIIWLGGFLIPLAIFSLIYDFQAMYQQVFTFRFALRQVSEEQITLSTNIVNVAQMWFTLSPLVIGALLGILTQERQWRLIINLWLSWLVLATLLLIWHIPLRDRYIVILVPPLAALSAIGVVKTVKWLFNYLRHSRFRRLGEALITLGLAAIVGAALVNPVKSAALSPSRDLFPGLNLGAVQYIWNNSLTSDCVVTDDQRFALVANRLVPANLSETSRARLGTGWLKTEDVINQTNTDDCPIVVYAEQLFDEFLPQLRSRLNELYFVKITFDQNVLLYTAKKNINKKPDIAINRQLGEEFILNGIDLSPTSWSQGQEARLALYWTAIQPSNRAYKVFVQVRNSYNELIGSFDHYPFPTPASGKYELSLNIDRDQKFSPEDISSYPSKGMLPTNVWPVGQTIREVIPLNLPANLPPGIYKLYIGLYDPNNSTRLTVNSEGENELLAATIEVPGK